MLSSYVIITFHVKMMQVTWLFDQKKKIQYHNSVTRLRIRIEKPSGTVKIDFRPHSALWGMNSRRV